MAEKLLVNVTFEETRVALVSGGVMSNLEIDTARVVLAKGNVYKGVVHRVNQSLQAAFVDYGVDKQGFLPVSEIHRRYYPKGVDQSRKPPIQDILKEGQELMVQVVKDEIGSKGASLSTYVSLPGRYLVLMAETGKTGISRRLDDAERKRLKRIIADMDVPDGFGVIIRTAGVEREEHELGTDLLYLRRLWEHLEDRFKGRKGPGLIHRERSVAMRFIRDYATGSLDEIIVDHRDTWDEIRGFCKILMPEMVSKVRHYTDPTPLFSRYQLEDQIDNVFARRIDLSSGGSIVIDQAEALVAIDVNSGRVKTDDIENTALTTNLEAASEIARQLKLRDMGGLVVVDFIDMRSKENIRAVEQAARDAFASDKAKVKFSRISEFGLMEISRQRLKSSIIKGSFNACPNCGGTGRLRSVESSSLYLLRRIKEVILRGTNYMHLSAKMPVDVANYLLNRKRRDLSDLERESQTSIDIQGVKDCPPTRAFVEILASSSQGRGARRVLFSFDLVRSDVEKREMDHLEELVVEAAQSRGLSLSEDEYTALYRRIEEQVAQDADWTAAQRASEMEAAVNDAVQKDRQQRPEKATGGTFLSGLKKLFGGTPTLEDLAEEPKVEAKKKSPARASDGDSAEGSDGRRSRRRRGERGRRRGGEERARASKIEDNQSSGPPSSDNKKAAANAGGDGEAGAGKKRRRRRRRRGRGQRGDEQAGGAEDTQPQQAEGGDQAASSSASSPKGDGEGSGRGGRGRGRSAGSKQEAKDPGAEAKGDAPADKPAPKETKSDASSDQGDAKSAKSESKPRPERKSAKATKSDGDPKSDKPASQKAASSKAASEPRPAAPPKPTDSGASSGSPAAVELPKAGGIIDLRSTGVRPPARPSDSAPGFSAKE